MAPDLVQILFLSLAALCAGTIDAIAGGGGLIALPALLLTGLPPLVALGTNKGQSVFGSFAALVRFARAGLVDRRRVPVALAFGFLGSAAGVTVILSAPKGLLRPVVMVLLVLAGGLLLVRPPAVLPQLVRPRRPLLSVGLIALALGAYDGFFGPGTGTFLILALVYVLGDTVAHASANAKVINFASNIAAAVFFAREGLVVWKLALPMAAAQLVGGALGAHLAVRGGDKLIRRVILLVVAVTLLKLANDLRRGE